MAAKRRRKPSAPATKTKGDRGVPGDGKGRVDVVGRSGVYPVSNPEGARGDAPVRGQMEWGQGTRGAAGYWDHGDSELMTLSPEGEPPHPEWLPQKSREEQEE